MSRVVIGTDPHKRSATIEVIDEHEQVLAQGRYGTDTDDVTVALRLLVDRRDELGRARTEVVSRIHHLLLEIVPGGAKQYLTRGQASYLLRTAPEPVGIVAETRHALARELIEEMTVIDLKIRAADKQLRQLVTATGSSLQELNGIGPSGCSATSATSTSSAPPRTSPRGTGPRPSRHPPATRNATACPAWATGASTGPCTSWPSSSCATTPQAAPASVEHHSPRPLD